MPYKDRERQLAAQKRYYEENQPLAMRQRKDRRTTRLKFLQEYKSSHPCVDCGIQYPHYVMDFDHLPGHEKLFGISGTKAGDRTMDQLLAEIAKCDLVCSNCHRHRTFMRLSKADLESEAVMATAPASKPGGL